MTTTFDLSILRDNLLLDEKQSRSTVDALASQHESLSKIDAQITFLETELCRLKSQRHEILKEQSYNRALIAPIRKMPAEILGEIFQRCIGRRPETPSHPSSLDSPLLLTRVCHRWREIAHGTPGLWKYIPIHDFGFALPFFRMSLQNSGSVGLDISIEFAFTTMMLRHGGEWPRTPQEIEIVQSVVKQQHRTRSLKIKAHHRIVKAILGPGRRRKLPLLQELSLIFPDYNSPTPEFLTMEETDHVQGTIYAPKLHTLTVDTIHGVGMSFLLKSIRPSSCLKTLNISGIFPGPSVSKFLTHCPAIEEITANSFAVTPPYPASLDPIVLTNLRKLSVVWEQLPLDGIQCLLEFIHAPMLQELAATYPEESQTILWDFVGKAGSKLCNISFTHMNLSSDEFTWVMHSLTGIQTLSLNTCTTPVGFWEMLTPAKNTPPADWIWPKLKDIEHCSQHWHNMTNPDDSDFRMLTPTEEYEAALVQFVERRAPPVDMPQASGGSLGEGCYLGSINFFGYDFRDAAFRALSTLEESTELEIAGLYLSRSYTPG